MCGCDISRAVPLTGTGNENGFSLAVVRIDHELVCTPSQRREGHVLVLTLSTLLQLLYDVPQVSQGTLSCETSKPRQLST